jgi:hypothetical protein
MSVSVFYEVRKGLAQAIWNLKTQLNIEIEIV